MESTKPGQIQEKNLQKISFMVKSVLESSCKRFSKSAIRENFMPKSSPTDEKTMSINDATILAKVLGRKKVEYHFFNLSLNNK